MMPSSRPGGGADDGVGEASASIGGLLRAFRRAAGLSQVELAERAGVSRDGVSALERGINQRPRKETLRLLADALGLSAADRARLDAAARRLGSHAVSSGGPLLATTTSPSGLSAAPTPSAAPLVGRASELATVTRLLARQGPRALLLAGEPGIGKSRLLAEASVRARAAGWTVVAGGCTRGDGDEPFTPVVRALDRYVRQLSSVSLRVATRGCLWLVRLLPELVDLGTAPLPIWTLPPEQERRLIFAAVSRFLANVAGQSGTLLVLDDLQWAGADALHLLTELCDHSIESDASPIRLIGAYRDTEVRPADPLAVFAADLARDGAGSLVRLGPLSLHDSVTLLDAVLDAPLTHPRHPGVAASEPETPRDTANTSASPADAAALRAEMVRRADGVPFFLISQAQALLSGVISTPIARDPLSGATAAHDTAHDTARGTRGHISRTILHSVSVRVAALPESAQELLRAGAVVGRELALDVLCSAIGRTEDEMVGGLEVAHSAGLLSERDGSFQFAHDLIREVVLAEVSTARQRLLHGRVAAAIERRQGHAGDEHTEGLAYHWARSTQPERAIPYLERAGDHAREMRASAEAARCYRELVERLDGVGRGEQAAAAREKLAGVLRVAAQYPEALAALDTALCTFQQSGDLEAQARIVAQIGWLHAYIGTTGEGLVRVETFVSALPCPADQAISPAGLASLYAALATLNNDDGHPAAAMVAAERAAEYARLTGNLAQLGQSLRIRAIILIRAGRTEEGTRLLGEAIPLLDRGGDPRGLAFAHNTLAYTFELEGDFDRAWQHYADALEVGERMGDPSLVALMQANRGAMAFYAGRWQEARTDLEAAVAMSRELRHSWTASHPLALRSVLAIAQGSMAQQSAGTDASSLEALVTEALAVAEHHAAQEAQRYVAEALAERDILQGHPLVARERLLPLLDQPGQRELPVAVLLVLLAWADLALGHSVEAQRELDEAVARAREHRLRPTLARALTIQALIHMQPSAHAEAKDALDEALALARAMPRPYAELKALYVYGQLHEMMGEPDQARERHAEALTICERLGEGLYRRHIERALAHLDR